MSRRTRMEYRARPMFLFIEQVSLRTGMSKSDINKAIGRKEFPSPIIGDTGAFLWREDEVEEFMAKRWLRRNFVG